MFRKFFAAASVAAIATSGIVASGIGPASAGTKCPAGNDAITSASFEFKGTDGTVRTSSTLWDNTKPGDTITVKFAIAEGCKNLQVSFASYRAPSEVFDASTAGLQELFNSSTGRFSTGTHTLKVVVPNRPVTGTTADCPNEFRTPNNAVGANVSGPYDSTCDGSPSLNGNGNGKATGKPVAGGVGQADNKNPRGQLPNAAQDGNNGYECDNNNGVGKSNPAHSGCTSTNAYYQVDFVRGAVLKTIGPEGSNNFYTAQGRLLDTDLG